MPTESELATEFETSRFTIREALRQLSEGGYVDRRQGRGTEVVSASPRHGYVQSFESLEELIQVAMETWLVLHDITRVALDAETAERIGGRAGEEWFRVAGVRWTEPGGRAICMIESYIPLRYAEAVEKLEDYEGPFFGLLAQYAEGPIDEVIQEIRAVPMPLHVSRTLGQGRDALALQLLRRYITSQGLLIASFNWHPADQLTYTMRIHRTGTP